MTPDPDLRRQPDFRHIFQLTDGETITVPHAAAKRTIDRRGLGDETVWEVQTHNGLRRLWPEDIKRWNVEQL